MEEARTAVQSVISKAGHHDTEVHERVAPAVQHETIKPHQHVERQIATDREVHHDHYHTTVQPVKDRDVLPEQHHHTILPVEHRTYDERDPTETEHHLRTTAAKFKDETVRQDMAHNTTAAPMVVGEHVHHHIHETIQPVIQKETIEPHVIHTTLPVHEVHHEKAQHHVATAHPAVTMEEFKRTGGSLTGREECVDDFKGTPRNIEQSLAAGGASSIRDSDYSSGSHTSTQHDSSTVGQSMMPAGTTGATRAHISNHDHDGDHTFGGHGEFSHRTTSAGAATEPDTSGHGTGHKPSHESEKPKLSLLDRLNSLKDADGDGKAGFLK